MVLYSDLEDAILSRLGTLEPDVEIEAMPEKETDFQRPFVKPRVTISYQHSDFSGSLTRGLPEMFSTAEAFQYEYYEVHAVIRARLLRGDDGCYATIKKVTDALIGYEIPPWGRIFAKTLDYLDNAEGVWTWDLVLVAKRPFVQALTDDHGTEYPGLEEVVFETTIN